MSDSAPPPPPPPPPPPSGDSPYGAPAPGGAYSAPNAVSYGWTRFWKNPGELLVPVLAVVVAIIVVEVIVQLILRATLLHTHDCTTTVFGSSVATKCGPGFFVTLLGSAIAGAFVSFIGQVLGAGLIKSALNVTDGKPVSVSEVFSYASKPNVITAAALVAIATLIGTILCYLPGLIVGFLTMFTLFFVVDEEMAPVDAIKASVSFTTSHLGETVLFYILAAVCLIIGAVLCLVGLLAAIPIVLIGAAYTFRFLHGRPVTAPA